MCAPRKALNSQSVRIRPTQRLTTSIEPTITLHAVTEVVKLMEGTYQAATKVNVLIPVIYNVIEADALHDAESGMKDSDMVSYPLLYRGRRQWHDMRWKLGELGRSSEFLKRYSKTSQKGRGLGNDTEEVGLTDSTLSMGKPCTWGSGQQWRDGLSICFTKTQRLE